MKRKLILLICSMLIGISGTWAQTDVTSKYLKNADFSTGWTTSNIGQATLSSVDEWTAANTGNTWYYGGAISYAGGVTCNSVTCSSNPDGGTAGGALALSVGWGCSAKYTQAVTFPAGRYRITYKAYNANSDARQCFNYIGFVEDGGTTHYGKINNFIPSTWMEESITVELKQATSGNISVGIGAISGGSGANAKLFIDNIKIEAYNASETMMPGNTVTAGSWTGNTGTYQSTYPEKYSESHFTGDAMTNTTTVDNGTYEVDVPFAANHAWIAQAAEDGAQNSYVNVGTQYVYVGIVNNTGYAAYEPVTYHLDDIAVTNGSLVIKVGNSAEGANWLTVGTPVITQMTTSTVNYGAFDLPATDVTANYWYTYTIPVGGKYKFTSTADATLKYTQTATTLTDAADMNSVSLTANTASDAITLAAGTIYLNSSAAATITIEAASYSYEIGSAAADVSYLQNGDEVTISYASAVTNDPDASLSIDTSGITFGGSSVTATATTNGFTFTVPEVTANTSYTLSIPAGCAKYGDNASSTAQEITLHTPVLLDQTCYIYSPKTDKFLSRGDAYGTAAIVDKYGIPVKIATDGNGATTIQFVDNALYMYNSNWAYGDGATPLAYTVTNGSTDNYSGYIFTSAYGPLYINGSRVANNGIKGDNYKDDDLTIWQIRTRDERDANKTAFVLEQHKAIAEKAGTTVTDEAGFTTFLSSYANTDDMTSSVPGASLTGSLDAAWTATNVRNGGTAYTINSNGTEFYQSAETFTQTVTGLDEGVYKVTLNGYFRQGSNANCVTYADYDLSNAYIQANDYQINLKTWASDRTADDAPNGQGAAKTLFDAGKYLNTLYTYVGSDGNLKLTICNPNYLAAGWMNFENLTLTRYYNETLDEAYKDLAAALTNCAPWTADGYTAYTTTKAAYESRTYSSVSEVNAAIRNLETAFAEYQKNNYDNDHPYDTGLIKNPSYNNGEDNWSKTQNQTGSGSYGVVTDESGDKIFQSTYNTYMRHETVYQEGIVVPAGTYKLSAMMMGTPKDETSTYIYATDGTVNHWATPVFAGNTWYGYLKSSTSEWTEVYTFITLKEETTLRVGVISWGNNYSGGNGGAFSVDDWKLEQVKYATEIASEYYLGDANNDGDVDIEDVTALVDGLKNGTVLSNGADANNDKNINVDDVKATSDIILSGTKTLIKDAPIKYAATVYAEQKNSENAEGSTYQLNSAVNVDQSTVTSISEALTTVKISVSGISNIQSVSIYAKGKENIAGNLDYNTETKTFTVSSGSAPSGYAKSMASDVVTVNNDNSATEFTAYLLPNTLGSGVTVTVRTTDDTYYTQDFDVTANTENSITFNNTASNGAWMATIPGDIHFNYLSIPGAHDAATSGLGSLGKCQSLTISELLNNGVRSLDLRPYGGSGITASTMKINHGILATDILFKDALVTVKDYLVANPTETVFILIHDEKGDGADDWKTAVLDCIQNVQDYVKVIDGNMSLDDCRGKMVIISRDDVSSSTTLLGKCGWGSSFGDKTVFYGISNGTQTGWTLMYQDEYTETNTSSRLSNIEKLLTDYIESNANDKSRIYINTTNISSSIESNAKTMNDKVATSTIFTSWGGRFGIISSDFICDSTDNGDDLFQMIVDQNYKYVYTGRTRK